MDKKRILIVGATGKLAVPVVREMARRGFETIAMVRNLEKGRKLLPAETELVQGDVADQDSLRKAAQNISHLYFHPPSTIAPKAEFIVETDGLENILAALPENSVLLKLSAIDAEAAMGTKFTDLRLKYESEQRLKESGRPFVVFRPTWFMEAIPLELTQNGWTLIFGKQPHPMWLIAAEDYARTVCNAVEQPGRTIGRTFTVQGTEPLTLAEAARIFVESVRPAPRLLRVPLPLLRIPSLLGNQGRFIYELMNHYNRQRETFQSHDTWEILGKPRITFAAFVASLQSAAIRKDYSEQ